MKILPGPYERESAGYVVYVDRPLSQVQTDLLVSTMRQRGTCPTCTLSVTFVGDGPPVVETCGPTELCHHAGRHEDRT